MSVLNLHALGRPIYLGQLYDATKSQFISGIHLFKASDISPSRSPVTSTNIRYAEVKTTSEKTSLLDVSAHLSVSILSGAVDVSGMGSFLKNGKESSDSTTVVALGRYRIRNESFDIKQQGLTPSLAAQELQRMGATHVVTSINYGGTVIGLFMQQQKLSSSGSSIKGKFSVDVLKGISSSLSASGSAELSSEDKDTLSSYGLSVELVGDYFSKSEQVPADAVALLAMFKKSPSLIGDGVPCEVELAPLSWILTGIPTFTDLREAEIQELVRVYDKVILLEQDRNALTDDVMGYKDLFPSFFAVCNDREAEVSQMVKYARGELQTFLEKNRTNQKDVQKVSNFRDDIKSRFKQATELFETDRRSWLGMIQCVRIAKIHGFPVVPISDLQREMVDEGKGTVVVVLIPENVHYTSLLTTYREVAEDIRKWRATIDNSRAGSSCQSSTKGTTYFTIYTDKVLDSELSNLDDETGSIVHALSAARDKSIPVFLTYGFTQASSAQLRWSLLKEEGWGVIKDEKEGWRYTGDVHKGLRHGIGVITYVDGSVYRGEWFEGKRDGRGEIFPRDHVGGTTFTGGTNGVYVDDECVDDGVLVDVTVYRGASPIQFKRIALRAGDATTAHIDKIGRVFDWQVDERYRVRVETLSGTFPLFEVRVRGTQVDPSEEYQIKGMPWPLGGMGEKRVSAYVC